MPPAAPAAGKPRNRRARLWLAMGAGIVALLCLGGVGVFISLYDEATKVERSTPDAVVDGFLRAYFISREEKDLDLFRCESGGDFAQLDAFRNDISTREKQYSIAINVSWGSLAVTENADRATVGVDLIRAISDGSERTSDRWTFDVVEEDGWRVCRATGPI
jgi:hypothetical protein